MFFSISFTILLNIIINIGAKKFNNNDVEEMKIHNHYNPGGYGNINSDGVRVIGYNN